MSRLEDHILRLRERFEKEAEAFEARHRAIKKMRPAEFDEYRDRFDEDIKEAQEDIKQYLTKLLRYANHENRRDAVEKFEKRGRFEDSVFIMTKYPDADDDPGKALQRVIDLVCRAVRDADLMPRLASDKKYEEWTWANVETASLGCRLGLAIVEDRYRKELNPNVAMEWGWMRGMGRPVILLIEKNFGHIRADMEGVIHERFDWDDAEATIAAAVKHGIESIPEE